MSANDIGAFMLGTTLGKSRAESAARIRAQKVERERSAEVGTYEERLSKIYTWYAEAAILAEVRRRARVESENAAQTILDGAKNGQIVISAEQFAKLFAHELDSAAATKFFVANIREHVENFVLDVPGREKEIRAALAGIESEL